MKSFDISWTKACCSGIVLLAAFCLPAYAQTYPVKPVRLIAPFPPGGSSDLIARIVAQKLSEGFPNQIIIENRPGAGSNLGSQIAARAAPDGYTLLITSVTAAINVSLFRNPGYDLLKDFAPIAKLAVGPTALVVHPSVPAHNVPQFIKLAQSRPGQLNYGSGGNGTPAHICGEMFRVMAKVNIAHVPYKGTGQSVTDLMAGQIHFVFASMPVAFPHMKTGRLRTLAVTGAKRTPLAPDLPTVAESGLPGYAFDSWWGLVTNTGVPPAIINTLNNEVRRVQQLPDVKERFADLGIDVLQSTPAELASFTRSEIERFAKIIRDTGIRAD
ncbi:MAG TPA: tripartite tricarboxylate transporter substrate binding protein [Burkholderiales bacterium]|nr:tripartite tricarboxylate transporter substrate binding protein [Burkholderiales bacterium]